MIISEFIDKSPFVKTIGVSIMLAFLLAFVISVAAEFLLDAPGCLAVCVLLVLGTPIAILVLPAILLLGLCVLWIGPELALIALFVDVTVEDTPPGRHEVNQIPKDPEEDARLMGMMHSVTYTHVESLERMTQWINAAQIDTY